MARLQPPEYAIRQLSASLSRQCGDLATAVIDSITEENWRIARIRPTLRQRYRPEVAADAEHSLGRSRAAAQACRVVPRLCRARPYPMGRRGTAANCRGARAPCGVAGRTARRHSERKRRSRTVNVQPGAEPPANSADTAEARRLDEARRGIPWRRWGPYLSERPWGTVREDYSAHGDAWEYFSHDHARSRAYRWGEDGIAGFGDDQLYLCLGLALWNERDPILKERLFGLTNSEGNHGEDVKELYYYLDGTPTHSWMRMLYKYPQAAFPYAQLLDENRRRGTQEPEFELLDTGVFDGDRYFDIGVTYAKAAPDDILMEV